MSSWHEERRLNQAAEAEQRRRDRKFEAELRREERREAKKEQREEEAQRRRDKAARRQARAARREKALTPGNVYRKGTLALVLASAAASLPAQIMHFASISLMLLPIPFALEGAAWVMNAGVAYADERKLAGWVRWLLRGLAMSAAGYAAHINLAYGLSLTANGLSAAEAAAVGWGLAAVTMLGPMFFEVRQWVLTLSAATGDPRKRAEEKARARHERKRRRNHRDVVKLAEQMVSAAPFGTLTFEDAFARAWAIRYGTAELGMTPRLHQYAVKSAAALAAAQRPVSLDEKTLRQHITASFRPLPMALPTPPKMTKESQVATLMPPSSEGASGGGSGKAAKGARKKPTPPRRKPNDTPKFHPAAKTVMADTARKTVTAVNGHHH